MARKTTCKCGNQLPGNGSTQCGPCKTVALRIRRAKDKSLEGFNPAMQMMLARRAC